MDSQWEFAVWHREPKPGVLWPLEGWKVYVYLWLVYDDTWQKLTQCHKAIILQLKTQKKNVNQVINFINK